MNRRQGSRVPVQFFLTEYVDDRPSRAMTVDISSTGLFVHKLVQPVRRPTRVVGVEFELPDTGETIWARGEICRDELDGLFHSTGIALTAMARKHARMLEDYVSLLRERRLRDILTVVETNRARLAGG